MVMKFTPSGIPSPSRRCTHLPISYLSLPSWYGVRQGFGLTGTRRFVVLYHLLCCLLLPVWHVTHPIGYLYPPACLLPALSPFSLPPTGSWPQAPGDHQPLDEPCYWAGCARLEPLPPQGGSTSAAAVSHSSSNSSSSTWHPPSGGVPSLLCDAHDGAVCGR